MFKCICNFWEIVFLHTISYTRMCFWLYVKWIEISTLCFWNIHQISFIHRLRTWFLNYMSTFNILKTGKYFTIYVLIILNVWPKGTFKWNIKILLVLKDMVHENKLNAMKQAIIMACQYIHSYTVQDQIS